MPPALLSLIKYVQAPPGILSASSGDRKSFLFTLVSLHVCSKKAMDCGLCIHGDRGDVALFENILDAPVPVKKSDFV